MRRLDAVDPRRSKLDIMQSEDGPWNQDHCDKAVWILSKCQSKYGDDSMARVLQLRGRKYGIRKAVTLTQLLDLFAEVSGDAAIHDWYAKIGIHLPADRRRKRTNQ